MFVLVEPFNAILTTDRQRWSSHSTTNTHTSVSACSTQHTLLCVRVCVHASLINTYPGISRCIRFQTHVITTHTLTLTARVCVSTNISSIKLVSLPLSAGNGFSSLSALQRYRQRGQRSAHVASCQFFSSESRSCCLEFVVEAESKHTQTAVMN